MVTFSSCCCNLMQIGREQSGPRAARGGAMVSSLSRSVGSGNRGSGVAVFGRVLVVVDGSESARAAIAFAENWARESGARVRIVELAEQRTAIRSRLVTDLDHAPRRPVDHLAVSAPTLDARNRRLVTGIADAAQTFGADVIVLGLERRRMSRHRFARSFRAQLARATDLPVMIPPPRTRARAGAGSRASRDGGHPRVPSRGRVHRCLRPLSSASPTRRAPGPLSGAPWR